MPGWVVLTAALIVQAAPAVEPPPTALAAHVRDGVPDLDDIGWMRGAFAGASAEQQKDWRTIEAWVSRCFAAHTAAVRAGFAAKGFAPPESREEYAPPLCVAVASVTPPLDARGDWDRFVADAHAADAVFAAFSYGAKIGWEVAAGPPADADEEARQLLRAVVREQVYRSALTWSAKGGPPLAPGVHAALMRRIGMLVAIEDGRNTAMLKARVAAHGWPTIPQVGPRASDAAWLIVQHADMDPLFQLDALRKMEPLAARGEVDRRNFAYLYDRVMLKTAGKQRYGTQWAECARGVRQLRPLESRERLDALRAEAGLEPLDAYRRSMDRAAGPCPPDG